MILCFEGAVAVPLGFLWSVRRHVAGAYGAAHAPLMFCISEAEGAAIRAIFHERGEFSAAVELRRLYPGITDAEQVRECVRTIVGWRSLPKRLRPARLRVDKTD
jgi:hypothetical protein